MTLRSFFLSSFIEFRSAVSEEKSKMSRPIRGQGGHLVFSDWPEKHKLGRGCWDLASYYVSLNSLQRFQRKSQKCLSQSEARAAQIKNKLGRGHWDLAFCQVLLNSVQQFQRRSRKCEKLTTDGQTDGRTMDDGQRVITIVHLSLRLRCTKNQGVFIKHYAPVGNKVQKAILTSRSKSRSQGHWPWCHLKGLH